MRYDGLPVWSLSMLGKTFFSSIKKKLQMMTLSILVVNLEAQWDKWRRTSKRRRTALDWDQALTVELTADVVRQATNSNASQLLIAPPTVLAALIHPQPSITPRSPLQFRGVMSINPVGLRSADRQAAKYLTMYYVEYLVRLTNTENKHSQERILCQHHSV